MSNIKTYEDLLAEEKRLQALLYSHRESIKDSLVATKASLNPFKAAINTVKGFFVRSKTSPLTKFGLDFGVDVIFRRFILKRAGWFTKIVLPFVVKNYSAYIVKERHKSKLFQKIFSFFKDGNKEAKKTAYDYTEDVKDAASNFKEDIRDRAEDIRDKTSDVRDDLKDKASDFKDDIKDAASDIKDDIKDTTEDMRRSASNKF
jgi:gas vesicle protein